MVFLASPSTATATSEQALCSQEGQRQRCSTMSSRPCHRRGPRGKRMRMQYYADPRPCGRVRVVAAAACMPVVHGKNKEGSFAKYFLY